MTDLPLLHHYIQPQAAQLTLMGSPAVLLHVTRPEELAPALAQRERSIVIEPPQMARWFESLEFWRTVKFGIFAAAVAWGIQYAIANKYKIDVSLTHYWKAHKTEGKVILSPRED